MAIPRGIRIHTLRQVHWAAHIDAPGARSELGYRAGTTCLAVDRIVFDISTREVVRRHARV